MSIKFILATAITLQFIAAAACQSTTGESKTQQILGFIPALGWTLVGIIGLGIAHPCLTLRFLRHKTWWAWVLPVASVWMLSGFFLRLKLRDSPDSLGLYIAQSTSIVLAPAGFLAFNYQTYGRLATHFVPREWALLNPAKVGMLFVLSDVTTFLIQAAGGGMMSSVSNPNMTKIGERVFLVGLILQGLSYLFFFVQVGYLHRKVTTLSPAGGTSPAEKQLRTCKKVLWVLHFSGVFILIRSAYRVVELAQGRNGYLLTHEVYFIVLDTLPLILAISCWIPFWPGKYIQSASAHSDALPMRGIQDSGSNDIVNTKA